MRSQSRRSQDSVGEEAKLQALYGQMKEGLAPSSGLQKRLIFQLLDTNVAKLERVSDHLRVLRNFLRISALGCSGLATIALGVKQDWLPTNTAQSVALILTASATFIGSVAALWNVDNYWFRNKAMLSKVRQLRHRLAFEMAATDGGEDLKAVFREIIDTLGDEYWEKTLNRAIQLPTNTATADVERGP
jgi:hypothetical protein